jgi:hypothetical protein
MSNKNQARVNCWLSESDYRLLQTLLIVLKQNKSELVRDLIRAKFMELDLRPIQPSDFYKQKD